MICKRGFKAENHKARFSCISLSFPKVAKLFKALQCVFPGTGRYFSVLVEDYFSKRCCVFFKLGVCNDGVLVMLRKELLVFYATVFTEGLRMLMFMIYAFIMYVYIS